MSPLLFVTVLLISLQPIYMQNYDNADKGDNCTIPAQKNQFCVPDDVNNRHYRRCAVDVFMSLCTLLNQPYNDQLWTFMCMSPNYCLGCRNVYTNCYNDAASQPNDEELKTYLGWYDALTMAGKFSMCDLGQTYVNDTMFSDDCLQTVKDPLESCFGNLVDTFYSAYKYSCSDWNDVIKCFLDAFESCDNKQPQNVLYQYFNSVVSISPCVGNIPVVGSAASSLTFGHSIVAIFTLLTIGYYCF